MAAPYKPFFNRTYLKILPWVVAIAIVLLTATSRPTVFKKPISHSNGLLYHYYSADIQDSWLRLVFPLPPASGSQKIPLRNAQMAGLTQAVQQIEGVRSEQFHDRFQLDIDLNFHPPKTLPILLERLSNTIADNWYALLKDATARWYLASQQPEQLLLANLKQLLNPTNHLPNTDCSPPRIFCFQPLALLLQPEKFPYPPAALIKALAPVFRLPKAPQGKSDSQSALNVTLQGRTQSHWLLLGTRLEQPASYLAYQVTFKLLHTRLAKQGLAYRLLLQPAPAGGFAAVLLQQQNAFTGDFPARLQAAIDQQPLQIELAVLKTQLHERYQQQTDDPEVRLQLFTDQLFYQRKVLSPAEFRDTLHTLDDAQINRIIQQLLSSIRISYQPF